MAESGIKRWEHQAAKERNNCDVPRS